MRVAHRRVPLFDPSQQVLQRLGKRHGARAGTRLGMANGHVLPVQIAVLLGNDFSRGRKGHTWGFAQRLGFALEVFDGGRRGGDKLHKRSCMFLRIYPVLTAELREHGKLR